MKFLLSVLLFSAVLGVNQVQASGCDSSLIPDVRAKLSEMTVNGTVQCWGPGFAGQYRCVLSPLEEGIPELSRWWLEASQLPPVGTPMQVTVEVYDALLYSDCSGPDLDSESNGYFYKASINGAEYNGRRYK